MSQTFIAFSSAKMAELIKEARQRVVVVSPSFHLDVGKELCSAADRLGTDKVEVAIDLDEKTFRLGYGQIEAVNLVKEHGINVRHHAGLRMGLMLCDDSAWAFSPVALYIEAEPNNSNTPNAIVLSATEAHRLLVRTSEPARKEVLLTASDPKVIEDARSATVEVSQFSVNETKIEQVKKNLEEAPPVKFDISRQVQVFQPYIQYVKISLENCSIQRRTINLPNSLMGLGREEELRERLATTFRLIEKNSTVSSKKLDSEVNEIRRIYTRSLGKDRVMLKVKRKAFDEEVNRIKTLVDQHRKNVENNLNAELNKTRKQLEEYLLPIIIQRPPRELLAEIQGDAPTKQQALSWLSDELHGVIPTAEDLIEDMGLVCDFKDVTYETLNDPEFSAAIRKAFPRVDWDKPFNEFTAAKEQAGS